MKKMIVGTFISMAIITTVNTNTLHAATKPIKGDGTEIITTQDGTEIYANRYAINGGYDLKTYPDKIDDKIKMSKSNIAPRFTAKNLNVKHQVQ